ncbi:MAG: hypothetical protein VX988_09445 [Planctomycetota bacterium]|nr:hypothetical protein [Planctomycetota bacterium]
MGLGFEVRENSRKGLYFADDTLGFSACELYCNEDPMYVLEDDLNEYELFEPDHPEMLHLFRIDGPAEQIEQFRTRIAQNIPTAQLLKAETYET